MSCIHRRTNKKTGMAAFAITILVVFVVVAETRPLHAQSESPSTQAPLVLHNSWSSGAVMPIAVHAAATGTVKGQVYVVGGVNTLGAVVADNQIYNPATSTWSTGAALPVTTYAAASAVVNGILYVFGGSGNGTNVVKAVWAYDHRTNTWHKRAAMPTARAAAAAAVKKGIVYVIGGLDANFNRLGTVESYNPATNTWTEQAPLLAGKSFQSAGLLGSTIVAADGVTSFGDTGDNEGYNASTNSWSSLTSDPTGRDDACAGVISGRLYVAGGRVYGGGPGTPALTLAESFTLSTNTWATLASMPQGTQASGSAMYQGQLYCFGGQDAQAGTVIGNVQIYQP